MSLLLSSKFLSPLQVTRKQHDRPKHLLNLHLPLYGMGYDYVFDKVGMPLNSNSISMTQTTPKHDPLNITCARNGLDFMSPCTCSQLSQDEEYPKQETEGWESIKSLIHHGNDTKIYEHIRLDNMLDKAYEWFKVKLAEKDKEITSAIQAERKIWFDAEQNILQAERARLIEWAENYGQSIYPDDIWIPLGERKDEIMKAIDELMKEKFSSRIDVVSAHYARWVIGNMAKELKEFISNDQTT